MELTLNNVTKRFGNITAVDHVTQTMEHGVYGLLGVNGAGKTTLMRMLCTLLTPTQGAITCDGRDIFQMDGDYRRILGYLPQDFGTYPDFSVKDYLLYIGALKGLRPAVARKRAGELMELTGLTRVAGRKMKKLSGGMRRRAGIAQAMLNDPKILILDEPTAGLDPNERIRFRNLISELSQERLVQLSTHIVSDVEYIANEIWLMKDGAFVCQGTARSLITAMPENVWHCFADKAMVPMLMKKYKISNIKSDPDGIALRIISKEKPFPDAQKVRASLEDVFLYYVGENIGGRDGHL